MTKVFLLLGSNLGDRKTLLAQTIKLIEQRVAPVAAASALYETQAWGKTDEPDYINQVVMLYTNQEPELLLDALLNVELDMGRERRERWGARVIDIDILFYGDGVINTPKLQVPHKRLHERRFTLEPLTEIAPGLIHPVFKKNVLQLLNELHDNLIVKKL
ncbi:2-amino-4-hydroxy-6-hydroxymethyldihydropteridine diphosphokinase [Mucilaginibacter sp. UR6-1]|uniref:2-amino-4-hydroxy-6- hydroxymethyldihydropteridine diphosphokinase n=1 Tax=Mucilaginibacter sp. UR6-1 TaxID=1435643 RepID=UPI001E569643|nr:2-amino-4-hydroxy-6-hydroxymethyldihydropteridine diphosphokinase [Mucilaginibacter sp. UR6-1]MCC8410032.1 2-amino-4-hydroxy-6-hydroxymethyldihydropteridine diphosphokinase [Mucilaginibacter sp. UR6-1]